MISCILFLLLGDRLLLLKDGSALEYQELRHKAGLVVLRQGNEVFSVESERVDWARSLIDAAHEGDAVRAAAKTSNLPFGDIRVTRLDVRQTSVIDLLRFLADMGGFNLFIDGSVKDQQVTLLLTDVSMNQALELILGNCGLDAEMQHETVSVSRP